MKESEQGSIFEQVIAGAEELLRQEAAKYERKQELLQQGSQYVAAREKFDDDIHVQPVIHAIESRAKNLGNQFYVDFSMDNETFTKIQENSYSGIHEQIENTVLNAADCRIEDLKYRLVTVMAITYSEHSGQELLHVVETSGFILAVDIARECPLNWHEVLNSDVDIASITDGLDELVLVVVPAVHDKQGIPHPAYGKDQTLIPFSKIAGIFEANI